VAPIVGVVVLAALGYFLVSSREPAPVEVGIGEMLALAGQPIPAASFLDRLSPDFQDGRRFKVVLGPRTLLLKRPDGVIVTGGANETFLVEADGIGNTVSQTIQSFENQLLFERGSMPGQLTLRTNEGRLVHATITPLAKVPSFAPGTTDSKIRHDDPPTFAAGTRYAFEGGVAVRGDRIYLYHLPETNPPYRVELATSDPGLRRFLEYAARSRYAIVATATLDPIDPQDAAGARDLRLIGRTGEDLVVSVSQSHFTKAG
jgi:hypothetical protein